MKMHETVFNVWLADHFLLVQEVNQQVSHDAVLAVRIELVIENDDI